ncbi:hypothetical protein [Burkholderia cenocepacia]|uniref:hypothetical protein n=1 Tax=Burkholderia cenocepacia TaxID=95486 RepID=UPI002AB11748|nr:hypothetical protein [Burkholderia cenocepacia]
MAWSAGAACCIDGYLHFRVDTGSDEIVGRRRLSDTQGHCGNSIRRCESAERHANCLIEMNSTLDASALSRIRVFLIRTTDAMADHAQSMPGIWQCHVRPVRVDKRLAQSLPAVGTAIDPARSTPFTPVLLHTTRGNRLHKAHVAGPVFSA